MAPEEPAPLDPFENPAFPGGGSFAPGAAPGPAAWDPAPMPDNVVSLRGRHRVVRQRGGLARSSTVLGVGVIAAVGAGGMAAADGKPPVPVSVPDLPGAIADHMPAAAASLPVVGSLVSDTPSPQNVLEAQPLTTAGLTTADLKDGSSDAGEALRSRILQQAEQQRTDAEQAQRVAAAKAAAEKAAKQAAAAKKKADAEAKAKAEAARLAALAKEYTLPVVSYTITGTFGEPGPLWSSGYHTGLDFAAPTGTPIKAVHSGTVTQAGWAGSYGYRTVVKLSDGSELWYCHQSSMTVSVGQKVTTGDVIGRVGATGNVTGPHLHLEVHTPDGTAIDPKPWLENKGLHP